MDEASVFLVHFFCPIVSLVCSVSVLIKGRFLSFSSVGLFHSSFIPPPPPPSTKARRQQRGRRRARRAWRSHGGGKKRVLGSLGVHSASDVPECTAALNH